MSVATHSPSALLSLSSASKIASYNVQPASGPNPISSAIELSQATHRINLVNAWGVIHPGSRILELGCGQGTCTAVLAEAVSQVGGGQVDAVDPAPLDYGMPFTLGEAQQHLASGPVGKFITFHRADPVSFLTAPENEDKKWDVAVLAHCIWYFASAEELGRILTALKERAKRVCVAEYALHATEPAAVPHVLAVLARAALEAHRLTSSENVQTLLSPAGIKEVAAGSGWKIESESTVVPDAELSDGYWEMATVVAKEFVDDVGKAINQDKVRSLLNSARDATVAAAEAVGGAKKTRTMDVWVATLVVG
ncbi:hypothetical protein B0H63DRAFT_292384 [Podospora didyma]|uniref:Methyltransferase domain-containing protein n=1 Tax=Podospora didyma TaxID=330526 RepID=A0AAE0K9E4_9PEZI|nr:hypothetical protein B0H63DRAFT_292384 [Podospora didyma]